MIEFLWVPIGIGLFLCCSIGMGWLIAIQFFKNPIRRLVVAFSLSIPFWSLQGYVLGYAHLRFVSFIFVLASLFIFLKHCEAIMHSLQLGVEVMAKNKALFLFIAISLGIQLLGIVGSGMSKPDGSRVYHRLQSSDGLMHVAFAQSMIRDFPPMQPGADGLPITNYHYWSNLYVAEISRVFQLPVDLVFFQIIPPILGILLVLHTLLLCQALHLNKTTAGWMLFFHFLAGNALLFFSKLFKNSWDFTLPAIDHGMIQFYNAPQTFAKVLLVFILWWWLAYMAKSKKSLLETGILASVAASLFGYKIYFGLYAYAFFAIWLAISLGVLIKQKGTGLREWMATLIPIVVSVLIALAIYLPPNKQAGGLFLAPIAWPKILLGQQNLNWNEWWLRMQVYEEAKSWKGMSAIYLSASLICLIGIAGTRLMGLLSLHKVFVSRATRMWWLTNLIASMAFFFVGMNFLQISGGANTFNFFIPSLIVWGWFSGIVMGEIIATKKLNVYIPIACVVILLSVPRPLHEVWLWYQSYTKSVDSFVLRKPEHEALIALKNLPDGLFISSPIDTHDYFETPYRSFFSNKFSYLSGLGILKSHNQSVAEREKFASQLFKATSSQEFSQLLAFKNISYVFLSPEAQKSLLFDPIEDKTMRIDYAKNGYKIVSRI